MSQWTDRVLSHAVWQQMETLGPALDQALSREGIDSTSIQGIERLRAILTFTGKRLAGADPELIQQPPLDGIAGSIQSILSDITAFQNDGDGARIVNANTHADSILVHLATVHYPFVSDDLTALRDASVAYRGTLEQSVERVHTSFSSISSEATALNSRLSELRVAIEAESAKLTALGTDFQARYSESEAGRTREFTDKVQGALIQLTVEAATVQKRLSELAAEIVTERGRLTTLGAEFQSQFSTAQESRGREFSETQTSRQDKFASLISDYTLKLTEQNAEFSKERETAFQQYQINVSELKENYGKEARGVLDQIEQHKRDVEKLVGVIGNLGVTSGYQKVANQAWWSMLAWQAIAVGSMLSVIWFAVRAFLPLTAGDISWQGFAGRIVLSLAIGVLGAYAAAQADKFMEIERRNRKLALELEAIGPYLAPLPVDKQEEFRLQIGDRTFGRDEGRVGRKSDKSPATVLDVLMRKEVREFMESFAKLYRP
jgi:hypothetical protein